MQKSKVFISSVQKEFVEERKALYQHFLNNALLKDFYEPVMFEKLPAASTAPDKVYLKEVESSQLYLMLLGSEYGYEDEKGLSPTEHEYRHAQSLNKDSLAFIKGDRNVNRHKKEMLLIGEVQNTLSYKRFKIIDDLINEVDKACIALLKHKGVIQLKNFDEIIQSDATIKEINQEKLNTFIEIARNKRSFPLQVGSSAEKVLAHLNMINNGKLTNSSLLAFGSDPQKYFRSAIIKCAHFHTLHVEKPIPDHRVISGDVFEQVDQAVDFVLSKISMSVGLREDSNQAPLKYEIPRPVVAEAIVNAVAHRDYNSNGSVQVMLFPDRLEIINPGYLPPELSIEKLKKDHSSYPANQLLAESLYQAGYIERYGTGTGEIFRLTSESGLKEPVFSLEEGFKLTVWRPGLTGQVTPQVPRKYPASTPQVKAVLELCISPKKREEIQTHLGLQDREHFRKNILNPMVERELLSLTIPDKPKSPKQQYVTTKKGKHLLEDIDSKV